MSDTNSISPTWPIALYEEVAKGCSDTDTVIEVAEANVISGFLAKEGKDAKVLTLDPLAHTEVADGSVYFVMLNASRGFEDVVNHIQRWAPKCAFHGRGLAVYGADCPEVERAVQHFCGGLGMTYQVHGNALLLITSVPPERLKPAPTS